MYQKYLMHNKCQSADNALVCTCVYFVLYLNGTHNDSLLSRINIDIKNNDASGLCLISSVVWRDYGINGAAFLWQNNQAVFESVIRIKTIQFKISRKSNQNVE